MAGIEQEPIGQDPIEQKPVVRRRPRWSLPILVVIVAGTAAVIGAAWQWPGLDRVQRFEATWLGGLAAALLLAGWVIGFSGWTWTWRLGLIAGVVLLLAGGIQKIHFDGDLGPRVVFRWEKTRDEILEEHRQRQAATTQALVAATAAPTDFPGYRGWHRDGIVTGPELPRGWAQAPKPIWRQPCGGGHAGFAVVGNVAVTIEQRRDQEAVVCYDGRTGEEIWVHSYPAHFEETLGGDGPRATPTIDGKEVFSLGATGELVCLDLATGQRRWSVNILENNGNLPWAMSGSPLVHAGKVYVSPGVQRPEAGKRALVAHDRETGKELWASGTTKGSYTSPTLATLGGRQQIVLLDGEDVAGYDPETGAILWRFPWFTNMNINCAQPLVLPGDRVFVSVGYNKGSAMLQIAREGDNWSVKELWTTRRLRCKFNSPIFHQDHIYGLDEGILVCLDARTGEQRWKDGRYGHGQLLLSGNLLLIQTEDPGRLVLVEATPSGHHELGRFDALKGRSWNTPALANGIAYVRNDQEMAAYDLRK